MGRKLQKLPIFSLGEIKVGNPKRAKWPILSTSFCPKVLSAMQHEELPHDRTTHACIPKKVTMKAGPEKAVQPRIHTAVLYFPTTRLKIVNFNLKSNNLGNELRFSLNYGFLVLILRKKKCIYCRTFTLVVQLEPFFCTKERPFRVKTKVLNIS